MVCRQVHHHFAFAYLKPDFFVAAEHRVSVPSAAEASTSGLPARYSIPYFVDPRHDYVIKTLDRFTTPQAPAKYESIRYDEYSARITKFQYAPQTVQAAVEQT